MIFDRLPVVAVAVFGSVLAWRSCYVSSSCLWSSFKAKRRRRLSIFLSQLRTHRRPSFLCRWNSSPMINHHPIARSPSFACSLRCSLTLICYCFRLNCPSVWFSSRPSCHGRRAPPLRGQSALVPISSFQVWFWALRDAVLLVNLFVLPLPHRARGNDIAAVFLSPFVTGRKTMTL